MYYYATLNPATMVCDGVYQYEEEQSTNAYLISIDSYDTSLIYRKKYVNGEWVDATPEEAALYDAHHTKCHGKWLDDLTGDTYDLLTQTKESIVAAINEVFQSASDGKTAIANAITGVDGTIAIPTNPTFAQLASLIGQLGGLDVAVGHMQAYTSTNTSITGTTPFRPRIVAFYNNQSGTTNFNAGLFVDSNYFGLVKAASDVQEFPNINFNAWGVSGGGHAENVFAITDTGFSATVTGLCTNIGWIALG